MQSLKATLTFRLSPELKVELQEEADKREMTASSYVESVLLSRPLNEQGENSTLQDLRERVLQLETENETLRFQAENSGEYVHEDVHAEKIAALIQDNKLLRQANHQLDAHLKDLMQQRDALAKMSVRTNPIWLSDGANHQTTAYLTKLKVRYPKASHEQLWLGALAVAEHNSRNYFIRKMEDYLNSNAHLLTSKTTQQ
jgi:predicted HicB family RNase H-like nuclease